MVKTDMNVMDFKTRVSIRLKGLPWHSLQNAQPNDGISTLRELITGSLEILYSESPLPEDSPEMQELDSVINSLNFWDTYKTNFLKLFKNNTELENDLFPGVSFSLIIIYIGRFIRNDKIRNFILSLKTEDQYRKEETLKLLPKYTLDTELFNKLKMALKIDFETTGDIMPRINDSSTRKFQETEEETFITDELLLELVQEQVGVLGKHRYLQEYLFFVGTKIVFSKNYKHYWENYVKFLELTYNAFPSLFETKFDFSISTEEEIRKRIQYYERVIKKHPLKIFNIWGLNEK
tara:strand:- start:95657 stop:96532 length:876 start_codon:yes stop_codon:yes gene_type:complete